MFFIFATSFYNPDFQKVHAAEWAENIARAALGNDETLFQKWKGELFSECKADFAEKDRWEKYRNSGGASSNRYDTGSSNTSGTGASSSSAYGSSTTGGGSGTSSSGASNFRPNNNFGFNGTYGTGASRDSNFNFFQDFFRNSYGASSNNYNSYFGGSSYTPGGGGAGASSGTSDSQRTYNQQSNGYTYNQDSQTARQRQEEEVRKNNVNELIQHLSNNTNEKKYLEQYRDQYRDAYEGLWQEKKQKIKLQKKQFYEMSLALHPDKINPKIDALNIPDEKKALFKQIAESAFKAFENMG